MKSRQFISGLMVVAWVCLVLGGPAIGRTVSRDATEKVAVTDGRYVHNVGELWNHVTNFGLIGSGPGINTPWVDAPSAMWPAGSGNEYLWAAGLWVGGTRLGERLVTTGGWGAEFLPSEAPGDTVHVSETGAPGGVRYPWPIADDDHDGVEDEEVLNGLDDDGDGLIDEDFAAIGDQHFVCTYRDTEARLVENLPDHTPLDLEIVQQSIQWSNPLGDDFIGYDFTITNTGVVPIEEVYLGLFSDHDIGPRGAGDIASDDAAGFWSGLHHAADGLWVPVHMSYMYDAAETGGVDGYAGWVVCGHDTDPTGVNAPMEVGVHSFQRFAGTLSFDLGGDPTNDDERYQLLSRDEWDPNTLPGRENDYRTLVSSGPFATLAPGESLSYQVALVVGTGLNGMLENAAEAVRTYQGVSYDRDGDSSNGNEFTVHWLRQDEAPVSARVGHMMATAVSGGVELRIESNVGAEAGLTVVRRASDGVSERRWSGSDLETMGISGRTRSYRLVDRDPVGWPRVYELVVEDEGETQILGQADLNLPAASKLELSASPNPFNPLVNLRITMPESRHAQLQIFDLRGHLVSTLWDGAHPGGSETLTWRGVDDAGRSMPSGVYEVRLATEEQIVRKRVTLVR